MENVRIEKIEELFNYIQKWNKNYDCWFRGQTDENFLLTPAAIRTDELMLLEDQFGRMYRPQQIAPNDRSGDKICCFVHEYLEEFKKEISNKKILRNLQLDNDLELSCLGQHYGLKTKLLDWTTDATVALFFATEKSDIEKKDTAFFIFKPLIWNEVITGISEIFSTEKLIEILKNKTLISNDFPVAFTAKKNSKRICRQSGYFTEHNFLFNAFDYFNDPEKSLIKIIIPYKLSNKLHNILKILGINRESIYVETDELDKITKSVKAMVERIKCKKYKERLEEYENAPKEMKNEFKLYTRNFLD